MAITSPAALGEVIAYLRRRRKGFYPINNKVV
jgi:hypothetical protein